MKILTLAAILVLQLSGAWPHLSASTRTSLVAGAMPSRAKTPAFLATPASTVAMPARKDATSLARQSGTSAIAIDRATATTLFSQDPTRQRPIASVAKLLTALVIMSRHQPDEMVTIGALPNYPADAELIGLQAGETYRLGDLVRAALVISANDAADALAIYSAGSITRFAAQMNLKLSEWSIGGARFTNPSGLDDSNYASAETLARIALLALKNPFIKDTVQQSETTFTSTAGRTLTGVSTNKLLARGSYYGIKTGYTAAAGQCFVGLVKVNGHEVITVILGSSDRFGETEQLVTWISRNYQWL